MPATSRPYLYSFAHPDRAVIFPIRDYVLAFLAGHGFEVLDIPGLNIRENTEIDRVEPEFMRRYARGLDRADADAVFVCYGALRALDIAPWTSLRRSKPTPASRW